MLVKFGNMYTFNGVRVYVNNTLMVPDGFRAFPRTWKDRLFSWPWEPWVATVNRTVYKPDPNVYTMQGMMVMHGSLFEQLKKDCKDISDVL